MTPTCPVCWTTFQPVGRQRFCSGNCRKTAWSRRQADPRHHSDLALLHDRALLDAGQETGFWDDNGRPAPGPHDIDEWRPTGYPRVSPEPGEPAF